MQIDWTHTLTEATITTIPTVGSLLLYIWKRTDTTRKENEKRAEVARKENEKRHADNTEKLDAILAEQRFLPQHYHAERGDGTALTTDGILRGPNGQKS